MSSVASICEWKNDENFGKKVLKISEKKNILKDISRIRWPNFLQPFFVKIQNSVWLTFFLDRLQFRRFWDILQSLNQNLYTVCGGRPWTGVHNLFLPEYQWPPSSQTSFPWPVRQPLLAIWSRHCSIWTFDQLAFYTKKVQIKFKTKRVFYVPEILPKLGAIDHSLIFTLSFNIFSQS